MIFSVFRHGAGVYDYYEGGGPPTETHAGRPPIRSHKALGATPEQGTWILPIGARKVGSGEFPKGRIATTRSAGIVGLGDFGADVGYELKVAAAAAIIWWAAGKMIRGK